MSKEYRINIQKGFPGRLTAGETFLVILFFTLFLLFLGFAISISSPHISIPFKISSSLADSGVIVGVCMFLKGKWRFITVAAAFAVGWLLLANLLYFRNFEDLIQASGYLNAGLGDPAVTAGAISSFTLPDLIFLILPFGPLAYVIWRRREVLESKVGSGCKLCIAATCFVSYGISYAGVFRRMSLGYPDSSLKEVAEKVFSTDIWTSRNIYDMHAFTGYMVNCAVSSFSIGMDLTPSDILAIRKRLAQKAGHTHQLPADSAEDLKRKNLIMIIVESLPFKVMERPDVDALIPAISNAVADSSSFVSRCRVLAGYGRSSDAQFIYNTGLLPLKNEALADNYAANDYPSIAKALRRPSMEIIGESKSLWHHALTSKSYGFDTLIDNLAPKGMNQDSIIFKRAEKEVAELATPFFLFVTTISMHDPYEEQKVTDDPLHAVKDKDSRDREYYSRLRHFDKSLGQFLSSLKQKGLYDESVIVILGDHEIRTSNISPSLHDDSVPFIIINSPLKCRQGLPTTQLDVFPSVIDMMGFDYGFLGEDYTGLGQSIFSDDARAGSLYSPTDEDYRISEMIIKGNPAK